MYAAPALLGAAGHIGLVLARDAPQFPLRVAPWFAFGAPFLVALFLRAAAWTYRLTLPHWTRKSTFTFDLRKVIGLPEEKAEETFEIAIKGAK